MPDDDRSLVTYTTNPVAQVVTTAGGVLGTYHGYVRNQSIGWALWWGFMGAMFPLVTVPIALAQGFGERK